MTVLGFETVPKDPDAGSWEPMSGSNAEQSQIEIKFSKAERLNEQMRQE